MKAMMERDVLPFKLELTNEEPPPHAGLVGRTSSTRAWVSAGTCSATTSVIIRDYRHRSPAQHAPCAHGGGQAGLERRTDQSGHPHQALHSSLTPINSLITFHRWIWDFAEGRAIPGEAPAQERTERFRPPPIRDRIASFRREAGRRYLARNRADERRNEGSRRGCVLP